MPNLNELKNRVAGVRGTRQVTHAMYLISASKSKRAKKAQEAVKPFFDEVEKALAEILSDSTSSVADSAFTRRPPDAERELSFVVGGDKGMAGGYNHNVIEFMKEKLDKGNTDVLMAGFIGRSRALKEGFGVDAGFMHPVMNPSLNRARDIADVIIEKFKSGAYRKVSLIYTQMESAIKQAPAIFPLLPLTPEHFKGVPGEEAGRGRYHKFHFEPNEAEVFDSLTPHYLKGVIYAALVEANTCEMQSRMLAMENATKSADDIISELSLRFNRARQSIITQDITEIVGGMPD